MIVYNNIYRILLLIAISLPGISALAQMPVIAPPGSTAIYPEVGSSNRQLKLPQLDNLKSNSSGLTLPPVMPAEGEQVQLSSQLNVWVNRIELKGNTVFPEKTVNEIIAPYQGRSVSGIELQALRHKLTLLYIEQGYINSGVIIPDQTVSEGVIEFQAIEGKLTQVQVNDNSWLASSYVANRVIETQGTAFNVKKLRDRLLLLQQDQLIDNVNAVLGPGSELGESVLQLKIKEARPYQAGIRINNQRSPSVGSLFAEIYGTHRNFTGWGDSVELRLGTNGKQALEELAFTYQRPLTAADTMLQIYYRKSRSRVTERPFDDINIKSNSDTTGLSIEHPVFRTPQKTFSLKLGFEKQTSGTTLLGKPFSFSKGVQNGKSKVYVIRFAQEWLDRNQHSVIAARSTFDIGIHAFGATLNQTQPDGRFITWLGQFQWVKRIAESHQQIIFRYDMHLSDAPLLPLKKYAVGGASTVRGFRENTLVRDQGWVASLEYRIPLFADETGNSDWQLAPFFDFGESWNKHSDTPNPRSISSLGAGLLWNPKQKMYAQIYAAHPFQKISRQHHKLQDAGVHIDIGYSFF